MNLMLVICMFNADFHLERPLFIWTAWLCLAGRAMSKLNLEIYLSWKKMKHLNHSLKHMVIYSFLIAKEIGSLRFNNKDLYRLPVKGFKFNLINKASLHLKHNMIIEMLNKIFLVWRWGWLRKKVIKIWLTHYTLIPSFSLIIPCKAQF